MNMTMSTLGNTGTGWGPKSNYRPGGGGVGYVSDFYKGGGQVNKTTPL